LARACHGRFEWRRFDRRGHGRTADTEAPFHYDDMASETIAFLEYLERRVHLIGHSDGGNIALLVAMRRPDLLKRVAVIGANYHYKGLLPMEELRPGTPAFELWADKYAQHSPDGLVHAPIVLQKTLQMFASEPTLSLDQLATITRPVLVMAGDDDVATLSSHLFRCTKRFPNAQLADHPGHLPRTS
jgi:pimeloyl-ACP methyl ester carboxylesterase